MKPGLSPTRTSPSSSTADFRHLPEYCDLMNWGLTAAEIEKIIGRPLGQPTQALRDYFIEKGIEFSEYKNELQSLIDA